jgi:hypothetical protein
MKHIFYLAAILLSLSSCEKVIELDLGKTEPTLVIEGNITNEAGPYFVKLTKTVDFNAASTYPAVTGATVVITDNAGQRDTLTNTGNGVYRTNSLQGIIGRTYNLNVVADGKTYTAQSTMPQNVMFDSLRYISFEFGGTTQYAVVPVFKDPIVVGNNYRFVLKVNGVLDKTYLVDNDNVNNGKVNQRPFRSNDIEIKNGDVVQVEMQCIDAGAYLYYFTLSQAQGNGPGGGTTPSNAPNGITGEALGFFSAYTTQSKSVSIP